MKTLQDYVNTRRVKGGNYACSRGGFNNSESLGTRLANAKTLHDLCPRKFTPHPIGYPIRFVHRDYTKTLDVKFANLCS